MSENPLPPESKQTPLSSKSTDHNYARFITQAQAKLQEFNPKYDKSIFEIKQEQKKEYPESEYVDPVAKVKQDPPTSLTALPNLQESVVDTKGLAIPGTAATAEAAQKAAVEELDKETNEKKLTELISQMRELEEKVNKLSGTGSRDLLKQITNLQSYTDLKSIEKLSSLGLNQDKLNELGKQHRELMRQYDDLVKQIRGAAATVEKVQDTRSSELEAKIKVLKEKVDLVHKHRLDSHHEEEEALEIQKKNEERRQQYQQKIDELKKSLRENTDEKVEEKLNEVNEELRRAEEDFSELKRYINELNAVKKNGEVLQKVIQINYDIVNDYTSQIRKIDINRQLNGLRENSDDMERAIQTRIEEITQKAYNIPTEEEHREELKTCKNEYFVNIKAATVNLIKITIDKLKSTGKNFKNNDVKARIYDQISNSITKDLDCYLFLNIVEFILFMINPPVYNKINKGLNYNNVNTGLFRDINKKIDKEAEKLKNVEMLIGFIERKRHLRNMDENWLCEKI